MTTDPTDGIRELRVRFAEITDEPARRQRHLDGPPGRTLELAKREVEPLTRAASQAATVNPPSDEPLEDEPCSRR